MEKITKEIYVCFDGKEFTNEEEAKKYEERLKSTKIYAVFAHPDLCEGKHLAQLQGFLRIYGDDFYHNDYLSLAKWWCERKYGKQYDFAASMFSRYAPFECWKVMEVEDMDTFIEKYKERKYSYDAFTILDTIDKKGCQLLRDIYKRKTV